MWEKTWNKYHAQQRTQEQIKFAKNTANQTLENLEYFLNKFLEKSKNTML